MHFRTYHCDFDLFMTTKSAPPPYGSTFIQENLIPSNELESSVTNASPGISEDFRTLQNPNKPSKKPLVLLTICFFITLVIVTCVVLAVLFLVERDVSYRLLPMDVMNNTINVTPEGFALPATPLIATTNENFFDIFLDTILITGKHPLYSNGTIPLGIGKIENAVLRKRSEDVIALPFLVEYKRDIDPSLEYFGELLSNCSNVSNGKLEFFVNIDINYHLWAKSGTINEQQIVSVPCPISTEEATRMQNLVKVFENV